MDRPLCAAGDAGFDQLGELIKVIEIPIRPEHAVCDLISDLHHLRRRALVFQRQQNRGACDRARPA